MHKFRHRILKVAMETAPGARSRKVGEFNRTISEPSLTRSGYRMSTRRRAIGNGSRPVEAHCAWLGYTGRQPS
jgi:hypothetical protein